VVRDALAWRLTLTLSSSCCRGPATAVLPSTPAGLVKTVSSLCVVVERQGRTALAVGWPDGRPRSRHRVTCLETHRQTRPERPPCAVVSTPVCGRICDHRGSSRACSVDLPSRRGGRRGSSLWSQRAAGARRSCARPSTAKVNQNTRCHPNPPRTPTAMYHHQNSVLYMRGVKNTLVLTAAHRCCGPILLSSHALFVSDLFFALCSSP